MTSTRNLIALITATFCGTIGSVSGQVCTPNMNGGPTICVDWNFIDPPEIVNDFNIDYDTNPAEPDVELRTGAAWTVWSVDESLQPGDMGVLRAEQAQDYNLLLRSPVGNAGARNVHEIRLLPAGGFGSSIVEGSKVSGTIRAGIQVQADSAGVGGEIETLFVDGDVFGVVRAKRIGLLRVFGGLLHTDLEVGTVGRGFIGGQEGVQVDGDMSGNVHVGVLNQAQLRFEGAVSGGEIRIDTIGAGDCPGTTCFPIIWVGDDISSNIVLNSGMGFRHKILIEGALLAPGAIYLNNHDMLGQIELVQGGSGHIFDAGRLAALELSYFPNGTAIILGSTPGATFSGTCTCKSLEPGGIPSNLHGKILGVNLEGQVLIKEGMYGTVLFEKVGVTGRIEVGGDVAFPGNPAFAYIHVMTDMEGTIIVEGLVQEDGEIVIRGNLAEKGQIQLRKWLMGDLIVHHGTSSKSLIAITDGLLATGRVILNQAGGAANAEGSVKIGRPRATPTPPVDFDGSITLPNAISGGGRLLGEIEVYGCHGASTTSLNICLCNDPPGSKKVRIIQDGCENRVTWSCQGTCN